MKLKKICYIAMLLACTISAGCSNYTSPKEEQNTQETEALETVENQTITVAIGQAERGGVYTGEVMEGKPYGKGRFDSKNGLGEAWYYEGMWENGTFNGEGKCVWENGQIKEGIYKNGIWTPTLFGFYQYILSLTEYGIDTNAEDFIKKHTDLFPAENENELKELTDFGVMADKVLNAPQDYGDKMLAIENAYVAQVEQMILEETGQPYTFMIIVDDNENIYEFYFIGELKEEIKAADTLKIVYGVPLGKSLYPNVSGGISKSLSMAGSYYVK